jgi:hypothetical protein
MPQKPFFRKPDGWWVVQLRQGSKRWQQKLTKGSPPHGKDTQKEAYRLFNEMMAEGADTLPAPNKIHMSDLLAAFLEHAATTVKQRTFERYKSFIVSFDELYGSLRPHQVTPEVVHAWLKTEPGWKGSRRGAIMTVKASVAATSEYGTARANGAWLLDLALNMKTPTIYDTIMSGDREERIVNQEATMAAREKQKLIKERFRSWVFTDPERTERLDRLYNDTYNNLRPRLFDGSHLDFPGMNQNIKLRQHQNDAVWRGMSAGNTLLAHAVGAGKTFTMAATGMKMKQAGLIKKPMFVVPNHLLEQFAREFMQLYPNAKLLVAAKEDLTRDRRKFLTAKIASGEWDGIIVTHSSFERIGMSRDYQKNFLLEQISEYDQLLREHAAKKNGNRNLIKTIEKQKAARCERLKDLLAKEKKDDGLVFDKC